jgi:hypothetical protein
MKSSVEELSLLSRIRPRAIHNVRGPHDPGGLTRFQTGGCIGEQGHPAIAGQSARRAQRCRALCRTGCRGDRSHTQGSVSAAGAGGIEACATVAREACRRRDSRREFRAGFSHTIAAIALFPYTAIRNRHATFYTVELLPAAATGVIPSSPHGRTSVTGREYCDVKLRCEGFMMDIEVRLRKLEAQCRSALSGTIAAKRRHVGASLPIWRYLPLVNDCRSINLLMQPEKFPSRALTAASTHPNPARYHTASSGCTRTGATSSLCDSELNWEISLGTFAFGDCGPRVK